MNLVHTWCFASEELLAYCIPQRPLLGISLRIPPNLQTFTSPQRTRWSVQELLFFCEWLVV